MYRLAGRVNISERCSSRCGVYLMQTQMMSVLQFCRTSLSSMESLSLTVNSRVTLTGGPGRPHLDVTRYQRQYDYLRVQVKIFTHILSINISEKTACKGPLESGR